MQTMHKYSLDMSAETQPIEMAQGAVLRRVDFQYGTLIIWAQVDPESTPETRTFTRYPFDPANVEQRMEMPEGAVIRHAAMYGKAITLWADENPANPKEMREFTVRGTSQHLPEGGTFVATIMDPPFVWHIFEINAQLPQFKASSDSGEEMAHRPKRYQFATELSPLPGRELPPHALETTRRGMIPPEEFENTFDHPGLVDAMCIDTTDANGFHLTLFVNYLCVDENDDSHQAFFAQALLRLDGRDIPDHHALTRFLKHQGELTPEAASMLLLTADGGYSAREANMDDMAETAHERGISAGDYLRLEEMV